MVEFTLRINRANNYALAIDGTRVGTISKSGYQAFVNFTKQYESLLEENANLKNKLE